MFLIFSIVCRMSLSPSALSFPALVSIFLDVVLLIGFYVVCSALSASLG